MTADEGIYGTMVPNNKVRKQRKDVVRPPGPPGSLSENSPVCYFYKVCTKDWPRRNFARLALSQQSREVCDNPSTTLQRLLNIELGYWIFFLVAFHSLGGHLPFLNERT